MIDRRTRDRPPGQQFVRHHFGNLRCPFDRHSSRSGDYPMRTAVTDWCYLTHPGHETRKVLVISPEIEDALDWRIDIDRLLHSDRATVSAYADQALQIHIGDSAQKQAEPERTESDAHLIAPRNTIRHQRSAGNTGQQPRRRRPVTL